MQQSLAFYSILFFSPSLNHLLYSRLQPFVSDHDIFVHRTLDVIFVHRTVDDIFVHRTVDDIFAVINLLACHDVL